MEPLSSFLGKYNKLPIPERYVKELVAEFLGSDSGLHGARLSAGILHIKAAPAIKQEIFLKKKKLLVFLKERGVSLPIEDIR